MLAVLDTAWHQRALARQRFGRSPLALRLPATMVEEANGLQRDNRERRGSGPLPGSYAMRCYAVICYAGHMSCYAGRRLRVPRRLIRSSGGLEPPPPPAGWLDAALA